MNKRFFAKRVTEDAGGLLVLAADFDKVSAEAKRLRKWVAGQPCENPQPINPAGCDCPSRCRDCGTCETCAARIETCLEDE